MFAHGGVMYVSKFYSAVITSFGFVLFGSDYAAGNIQLDQM